MEAPGSHVDNDFGKMALKSPRAFGLLHYISQQTWSHTIQTRRVPKIEIPECRRDDLESRIDMCCFDRLTGIFWLRTVDCKN